MAQNSTITIAADDWTQVTNGDATAVRVQNLGSEVMFKAAVGAVKPTDAQGALFYSAGNGFDASVTLSNLFPGISGANRLYARCSGTGVSGLVSVSHA